jgi:beta-N-acetylhexosaminidase
MTCHSNYTAYDPDRGRWPASLSHNIVTKLLRHQYAFDGLAMTDDLDMGAILNEVTFEQAIQEAVRAGNDLVMICHRVEMVELARQHLEGVEEPAIHDALVRIEKTKKRLVAPDKFDLDRFAAINRDIWQLRVDTLGEEAAKNLSVEDGKRSPVELY